MDVVYIGEEFYRKSGTMMSSVYKEHNGTLSRTDWGFIQIALEKGEDIHIRQANADEMNWAYRELLKWVEK